MPLHQRRRPPRPDPGTQAVPGERAAKRACRRHQAAQQQRRGILRPDPDRRMQHVGWQDGQELLDQGGKEHRLQTRRAQQRVQCRHHPIPTTSRGRR